MSYFLRAFSTLSLVSLLSACSINGSYPDATEPDAAKLRFISNTQNSTLDFFDAQHCAGRTTGMLNNSLMTDTQRRVGMIVPPPEKARGLLEVKLAPGKPVFMRINTNGSGYVCAKAISFTPEAGKEYEVTFDVAEGSCITTFQRLQRFNGKDERIPQPMIESPLQACAGSTPMFPKQIPETPKRAALIGSIVDTNLQLFKMMNPQTPVEPPSTPKSLEDQIAKRKAAMGSFTLPEAYWTQYRQNFTLLNEDAAAQEARTMGLYNEVLRYRLSVTEDAVLEQWLNPTDTTTRDRVAENDKVMAAYYINTRKSVMVEVLNHHLARMGQLDQRFEVCAHFDKCWH
ncbi:MULTISPECIES: hypothetical protein [Pseudomonas]|uniref:Lipoprotein n=1 Tax=Pseudomonas azotoformans TaxID=47878 RepID=A0A127HU52_PSEAZ|nr:MULTISPECIES: hypothetical protein [Pseudomonas fluorescens group]AMN78013.1 hypothetical protein AYR47_06570 [Pseudomonas azotoformans]ETK24384.1 putative lipoprotein [Pseudomonas sp. FH1]